jgi:hypothetical protein
MSGYSATQIRKPAEEQDFEKKIGVLFREILKDPNVQRVGRRGQEQNGLDLVGRRGGAARKIVGIQCKLKGEGKKLTEAEVRAEVAKALKYTPRLLEYFIVTTAPDDTKIQQLVLALAQKQAKQGRNITIEVWGWGALQERINEYESAKEAFDPGFSPSLKSQGIKLDAILGVQAKAATGKEVAELSAKLDKRSSVELGRLPTAYADQELRRALSRALRRRGFAEADVAKELGTLAERALNGDLALGTWSLRLEVLERAVRSSAGPDTIDKAEELLARAREIEPSFGTVLIRALIADARGETESALQILRQQPTPDNHSAVFNILSRDKGDVEAFRWLELDSLGVQDFSPLGVLNVLIKEIERGRFAEALRQSEEISPNYFQECPVLFLIKAQLILASILPADQKAAIFGGLPINPGYLEIASDLASHKRLQQALADTQTALAAAKELELPLVLDFLEEFELWLQVEDRDSREAALARLTKEIAEPSKTLRRVRLALAYDIPFDKAALARHLRARKTLFAWNPDEQFSAFLLEFSSGDPAKLAEFFDEYRDELFAKTMLSLDALAGIEVQSLARSGRLDQAKKRLAEHRGVNLSNKQADELAEVIESIEKGDELERIRLRFEKSNELSDLRLLVNAQASKANHRELANFAPRLARETHRIEDFGLALRALFNERRYAEVLALIDELPELYTLDDDFKSIKGWSLFYCGRVVESRAIARELLTVRNQPNDRELAINTAIETGDWGYLQALLTREVSRIADLDAQVLIRLARVALEVGSPYVDQFRDAALAKSPDDPQVLLGAYMLSVERGDEYQETRARDWFQRAVSNSGPAGPIHSVPFKEIVEHAAGWNQRVDKVNQMLRRAESPMTLAAHGLHRQPLDLLLGQALRNSSQANTRAQVPILAFSGGRRPVNLEQASSIALDVSVILTLEYLGLLQETIEAFDRVIIAPTTLSSLFVERQFLRIKQPSEKAKAERIQRLIASGRLQLMADQAPPLDVISSEVGAELAEMLKRAQRDKAIVIRSAPVFKIGSLMEEKVDLSSYSGVLADTRAALNFLSIGAKIDASTETSASVYLRAMDEGWSESPAIHTNSILYLDELSVTYLDHVGLLAPLTSSVSAVFIAREVDQHSRAVLESAKQSDDLVARIEHIRATLNAAVESSTIGYSARRLRGGETADDDGGESFPSLDLISDLSDISVVACDDRFLNKEEFWTDTTRRARTACTLDIIENLRQRGSLVEQQAIAARHKLRAAGYCAVPIYRDELLELLKRATFSGGVLAETPELRGVRESLSLPKRADVFLPSETAWLLTVRLSVVQAIRELWSSETKSEALEAKSDWLLSILPDPMAWCINPDDEQGWAAACQQSAMQAGLLLFFFDKDLKRRAQYMSWVNERIIEPMYVNQPQLLDSTIAFFKKYLKRLLESNDER